MIVATLSTFKKLRMSLWRTERSSFRSDIAIHEVCKIVIMLPQVIREE